MMKSTYLAKNLPIRVHAFCFMLFSCVICSYSQKLYKSAINTIGGGSSHLLSTHQKNQVLLQSVGQSSIIGTKHSNWFCVQQGFLSSSMFYNINNREATSVNETFTLIVYPNPFTNHVQIKFSKKTRYDIYINLFDFNGKQLLSQKHTPTDQVHVPLLNYSIGTYILHVQSGTNSVTKKLLKSELK